MNNFANRYLFTQKKRRRGDNFTEQEKQKIFDLITPPRLANLENKRSSSEVIHLKRITWIAVMHDYNAFFPENKRSVSEIKGLWKRLKYSYLKSRRLSASSGLNEADSQLSGQSSTGNHVDLGTNGMSNELMGVESIEETQELSVKKEPFLDHNVSLSTCSFNQETPPFISNTNSINASRGIESVTHNNPSNVIRPSSILNHNFDSSSTKKIPNLESISATHSMLSSLNIPQPELPSNLLNNSDALISMAREKHLKEMQLLDEQINYFKLKQHLKLKELELLSRKSDS